MRVFELARKLGITEKETFDLLKQKGLSLRDRMSLVDSRVAASISVKKEKPKKEPVKAAKKPKVAKPKSIKAKVEKPKKEVKKKEVKKLKPKKEIKAVIKAPAIKPEAPKKKVIKEEVAVVEKVAEPAPKIVSKPVVVPKKEALKEPAPVAAMPKEAPKVALKILEVKLPITLKDLAVKLQVKPSLIIKDLLSKGKFITINQLLDPDLSSGIAKTYGYELKNLPTLEEVALSLHKVDKAKLKPRQPVVTFMGHVDHGKTSLLDAIRETKVVEGEHGGITQHIGAYEVALAKGKITFLDTPGHEAFTAIRARGANVTDIVVLVVAADDGVMPQTEEAIDHARAAGVPIIVALNKIDKPNAEPDKVKKQLAQRDLNPEEWGGKTIAVGVSAKTGQGIDNLLEMILLEAEMLELKAEFDKPASGVVIESKLTKGRGPVVTLLVRSGVLKTTDTLIAGEFYGKIKAMFNDRGKPVETVNPAVPVEVLGLSGTPKAGEQFFVVNDEREARQIASERHDRLKSGEAQAVKRITLDDISLQAKEGKVKELKIILKADVQGSLEAVKDSLTKLDTAEVQKKIIHGGVGRINNSDVVLAEASGAIIIGFNIEADDLAKETAEKEGVEIRTYRIIYELINEIKQALEGLLEPKLKEKFIGKIVVKQVFKLSKSGVIAGCFVEKGSINRNVNVRLKRNGEKIFEGKIGSLKRFKDDVRDVQEGYECGIGLSGYDDIKAGDVIEAFEIEKIARKL